MACLALIGCDSRHRHYLENAALMEDCRVSPDRPAAVRTLLAGHYIHGGRALVLIERVFDHGSLFVSDSGSYRKLTIELGRFEFGAPIKVPGTDVRLFYTPWLGVCHPEAGREVYP